MTDFSKLLNPEQYAAATAGEGPLLVLAAAGTGKTRTLVHRVAYLIEQGVPADRILLLTFTNRAAREMMERAQKVVGPEAGAIWSGTFHSICARFLRRYSTFIGYQPQFSIIDTDDQKKLINEIIKKTVQDPKSFVKKEAVLKMISTATNEGKSLELVAASWQSKEAGVNPQEIVKVAEAYVARKKELNAMDFDDLLVNGLKLLKTQDRVREMFQEHFLYILVDEYQDTNGLQAEFTDILAAKHRNIMAVGDDFQCIYTWRGAQIENILNFPKRWEGCKIVKLERNYRSVPAILEVANCVMKDAEESFEKKLKPIRGGNSLRPSLIATFDGRVQAADILQRVEMLHENGYRYSDMAILYRSHYQAIEIQMALPKQNIPFRITSGIGFFEQVHIKDVLAYLRLLLSATDELSFMRFICLLPSIGDKTAANIWKKLGHRFNCHNPEELVKLGEMLSAKSKGDWPALCQCFKKAEEHLKYNEISDLLSDYLDFFYQDYLHANFEGPNADERMEEILELAKQIAVAEGGLGGFLSDVALYTNLDSNKKDMEGDRITLSTVHQAKGMEWPVVFIPWCTEGKFPSTMATKEGRMDEERRLFYVAVTRAKDRLFLYSPGTQISKEGGIMPAERSIFIKEIPEELLEVRQSSVYVPMAEHMTRGFRRDSRPAKPAFKTYWRR